MARDRTDADADRTAAPLLKTPLHALHVALGARMVPFAGYDMPVQYPTGILAEHTARASSAGLFDVSHMGQAFLVGADHATTARARSRRWCPADIVDLAPGRQRYTQLLNEEGGILDDLMVTRLGDPARTACSSSSSTPPARRPTTRISRRACRPASSCCRADDRAL